MELFGFPKFCNNSQCLSWEGVLLIFVAVIKHHDQEQLLRESLFWLKAPKGMPITVGVAGQQAAERPYLQPQAWSKDSELEEGQGCKLQAHPSPSKAPAPQGCLVSDCITNL